VETLSLWPRQAYGSGCSCPPSQPVSQSRLDRAHDSLTLGGENQVVRENAGWSRSPRAQGSLLLMLGVLRRIGQHGGRYDPSTVKRRERERERVIEQLVQTTLPTSSHKLWRFYCIISIIGSPLYWTYTRNDTDHIQLLFRSHHHLLCALCLWVMNFRVHVINDRLDQHAMPSDAPELFLLPPIARLKVTWSPAVAGKAKAGVAHSICG